MTEQGGTGGPAAGVEPGAIREEAERLVAAGLAVLSTAADRIGAPGRPRGGPAAAGFDALGDMLFGPARRPHRVANDSPECCRCPVCQVISAARHPDPGFAERLATGVGTVAEGAARVLRAVAGPAGPQSEQAADRPAERAGPAGQRPEREPADPWAAAL